MKTIHLADNNTIQ